MAMDTIRTSQGLDLIFVDDAQQGKPSRKGMGPLTAAGGLIVPGEKVHDLEQEIEHICRETGFPQGEAGEFKWSPKKKHWMRRELVGKDRIQFFTRVLTTAKDYDARAVVVVEDTNFKVASSQARSHEEDVIILLAERFHGLLEARNRNGLVIMDRPGGGREGERSLIAFWEALLASGTRYMEFEYFALNVLTQYTRHIRLLQLADLVTSCTTAMVAGETRYAPAVFPHIQALMVRGFQGQISGYGLKIHPDARYGDLYHNLLGELWYKH